MAKRRLSDTVRNAVADIWEFDGALGMDEAKIALLADIARSLREITSLMRCKNVSGGFVAMQSLERLAKEFVAKPKVTRKRKTVSPAT